VLCWLVILHACLAKFPNTVSEDRFSIEEEPVRIRVEETIFPSKSKRVAIAVSVTAEEDPKYLELLGAVSQAVYQLRRTSKFDIDLIAFVLPHMYKSFKRLRFLGFQVLVRDIPLKLEEVPLGHYRKRLPVSGCCGMAELLKLHALTLTEYHRVLHIDADVVILQNIDELFDAPDDVSLLYTNSTLEGEVFSGGVFAVRPCLQDFESILAVMRTGDYRYSGTGWKGSGVGYGWGGETIQGIMPYYYLVEKKNSAVLIDRCIYNNQGSEFCASTSILHIKMAHMTLCQKPWHPPPTKSPLSCKMVHEKWWQLMHSLQDRIGVRRVPRRVPGVAFRLMDLEDE